MSIRLGYTGTFNDGGNDAAGTDALVVFGPFGTDNANLAVRGAELYIFGLSGSGTRSQKMRLCLFQDSAGAPSLTPTLTSDEQTIDQTFTVGNYVQFTTPAKQLLANTSYWVGVWWGTQVGGAQVSMLASYQATTLGPATQRYNLAVTYSSTANPTVPSWSTGDARSYKADFLASTSGFFRLL